MSADKKRWKLQDDMEMTLDGVEHRFHVRERDNCIAIVLTQPGWAAAVGNDYWYVSIEELKPTGQLDEGQAVRCWNHRSTHPSGVGFEQAMKIAIEWYVREAKNKGIP